MCAILLQSSGLIAEKMVEWIKSEECMQSCIGLQRTSVLMSTDGLSQKEIVMIFVRACRNKNIVAGIY